jgi:hypothetical protein
VEQQWEFLVFGWGQIKLTNSFDFAVANTMPAESYNFRPNPEEMSFGQLMAHIAGINEYACAIASGLPRPTLPPKIVEWSKDTEKVDVSKETVGWDRIHRRPLVLSDCPKEGAATANAMTIEIFSGSFITLAMQFNSL